MIMLRPGNERGHANHGWLDSHHTFSFADYHDPRFMGFRSLRVINEDRVSGGSGFGMHSHRDMEIVTYVLSGALEHRDSLGNHGIIKPGELQRITAGTGIQHSEFNSSLTEEVHFLQIWILPAARGLKPGYEQKSVRLRENELQVVAARGGKAEALHINQDVRLSIGRFNGGREIKRAINGAAWVQMTRGKSKLNGRELNAGDAAALENEPELQLLPLEQSELLLFEFAD
jgi:quercetin 2,3-dioxygenase